MVVIGVIGIIVYSEMCGRIAAISKKAVFDVVRERVGFKAGLVTLIAAQVVNLMTLAAEGGGHRPAGVVLVGARVAEAGDQGVALGLGEAAQIAAWPFSPVS